MITKDVATFLLNFGLHRCTAHNLANKLHWELIQAATVIATTGIAADNGSFNPFRQVAPICSCHSNTWFFWFTWVYITNDCRSVQPFLQGSWSWPSHTQSHTHTEPQAHTGITS